MAVEQIGLNFTNIQNITGNLTINIETDPVALLNQIPSVANSSTNHHYAWIMMFVMTIILYWTLSDKTPFGDFLYSDSKALAIALGVVSVWGITNMEINFYTNFQAVASFIVLFLIFFISVLSFENRE